jgi:hypothetical protein
MHNGTDTNYYNIELANNRIMILPDAGDVAATRRFKPHNLPGRKTGLVYWFYPVGTMVLWVPGMGKDQASMDTLHEFAADQGLIPLEEVFPDFESPLTGKQFRYYVDTGGNFDDLKEGLAQGIPVGTVAFEKKVFGLQNDTLALEEKTVYARLPGMYD